MGIYLPKRTKELQLEKMSLSNLVQTIKDVMSHINADLCGTEVGNQQATQRVRVRSLQLEDFLKEFRSRSLGAAKELRRIKKDKSKERLDIIALFSRKNKVKNSVEPIENKPEESPIAAKVLDDETKPVQC